MKVKIHLDPSPRAMAERNKGKPLNQTCIWQGTEEPEKSEALRPTELNIVPSPTLD